MNPLSSPCFICRKLLPLDELIPRTLVARNGTRLAILLCPQCFHTFATTNTRAPSAYQRVDLTFRIASRTWRLVKQPSDLEPDLRGLHGDTQP
jgi:hypothetical protein